MKRAERHSLKKDEFVSGLDAALAWMFENQKTIVNGILVVMGAGLLLGGLYIYRSRQSETADALLSDALEQYHGFVESDAGAEAPADVPTFDSNEARYQAALESFTTIADEYGSYDASRRARYYVALCQLGLADLAAAETALDAVRSGNRDLLYYLATQALAGVRIQQDDAAGAAELYRGLVEDTNNPLPKDVLLFELAKTEEQAGNVEQALTYYERMLAEYPQSQLRGDALNRSETLEFQNHSD